MSICPLEGIVSLNESSRSAMRPKACSRLITPFFSSLVVSSLVASGSEPKFSALDLTSCSGPTFAEIFYSNCHVICNHVSILALDISSDKILAYGGTQAERVPHCACQN